MCKIVEDMINDEKKEIALKMIADGNYTPEKIAEYFNFTLEEVNELIASTAKE